jgi:hypothetical protein
MPMTYPAHGGPNRSVAQAIGRRDTGPWRTRLTSCSASRRVGDALDRLGEHVARVVARRPTELTTGPGARHHRDVPRHVEPPRVDRLEAQPPGQRGEQAQDLPRQVHRCGIQRPGHVGAGQDRFGGEVERPRHAPLDGGHDAGGDVLGVRQLHPEVPVERQHGQVPDQLRRQQARERVPTQCTADVAARDQRGPDARHDWLDGGGGLVGVEQLFGGRLVAAVGEVGRAAPGPCLVDGSRTAPG